MKVLDYDGTDHLIDKIYDALNSGGSADYIVEEGTSGIWTYRKWASGVAECWGSASYSGSWITWGSLYVLNFDAVLYPFNFYSIPTVQYTPNIVGSGSNSCWACAYNGTSDDEKKRGCKPSLLRPSAGSTSTYSCNIHAKGLWKEFTPSVMKQGQSLRTWNFTPTSGISMSQNGAVVRNGIAMGTLIINGSFNATANTYKQIGTTTDKPQGDYVLFDCYRGADALYEGVIRITSSGSVDFNSVRGMSTGTIYLQLVYTLTD